MLYPCMFCVALPMDLLVLCVACLTVFVNCLVKQFAICLGVFVIFLLSVVGGALLDRPCMVFHRMCVLCVCCALLPFLCLFMPQFAARPLWGDRHLQSPLFRLLLNPGRQAMFWVNP